MKNITVVLVVLILSVLGSCKSRTQSADLKIRTVVDSIGFAKYGWQMDSIVARVDYSKGSENTWRVAIVPHDDYTYVGDLYPAVLNGIKAKTVILFGVAHRASEFGLENKIIFDSYDAWSAPYGNVIISDIRERLIDKLTDTLYVVDDKMQGVEHSLESLIPFLQHNNRDVEIVPVLVPAMSFDKMNEISMSFADALSSIINEMGLKWGEDIAIVITTDAVHYGDEEWGGRNYARFGTDSAGLVQAINLEMEIIDNCLIGEMVPEKAGKFVNYTVQDTNFRDYKWTWCGRYSVPFGLLASYNLNQMTSASSLSGEFVGYSNSIDHPAIKVDDLNMGVTAVANNHHWVGYSAIGYK